MNNLLKTILKAAAVCTVCCITCSQAHADEMKFGDWTVSVNSARVAEAPAASDAAKREYVVREVREVRHVRTEVQAPRYTGGSRFGYGGYGGSNYSIYFPWRNYSYRGFTSFYRPRTIYNYGYSR